MQGNLKEKGLQHHRDVVNFRQVKNTRRKEMKIKIEERNKEKINSELNAVQKRCTARTTYYEDVVDVVDDIQKRLDKLMYRKDQVGISAIADPNAQDFPSAYRGEPESTIIIVKRFPSGWFMTGCHRSYCCRSLHKISLKTNPEHEEAIINFVLKYKNW